LNSTNNRSGFLFVSRAAGFASSASGSLLTRPPPPTLLSLDFVCCLVPCTDDELLDTGTGSGFTSSPFLVPDDWLPLPLAAAAAAILGFFAAGSEASMVVDCFVGFSYNTAFHSIDRTVRLHAPLLNSRAPPVYSYPTGMDVGINKIEVQPDRSVPTFYRVKCFCIDG